MHYFVVLTTLASIASAARLEKVYLPPHSGTSSGANAGLQAPYSAQNDQRGSRNYQGASQNYAQENSQNYAQGGSQNYAQGGSQNYAQGGSQNYAQGGSQNYAQGGSQNYAQGGSQNYAQGGASAQSQAEILKYENEINEDGYHYAFETSDGTKAEQEGRVLPGAKPEEGSLQVSGSYSYIGDDGQEYSVTYTADENGFKPQGAHLPTPPPIPEEILKSLQLTAGAGSAGHYDSPRSSYDADNGY